MSKICLSSYECRSMAAIASRKPPPAPLPSTSSRSSPFSSITSWLSTSSSISHAAKLARKMYGCIATRSLLLPESQTAVKLRPLHWYGCPLQHHRDLLLSPGTWTACLPAATTRPPPLSHMVPPEPNLLLWCSNWRPKPCLLPVMEGGSLLGSWWRGCRRKKRAKK